MSKQISFALRFDLREIDRLAKAYSYPSEGEIEKEIAPRCKAQGFFTKDDFLKVCKWKSERPKERQKLNHDADVRAVTALSLATGDEYLRICLLMSLHGVSWPTASVFLHFAGRDYYPILDIRALWSLGIEKPVAYTFDFWWRYTLFCRKLADEAQVSMRTLDRALWQFSESNQRPTLARRTESAASL